MREDRATTLSKAPRSRARAGVEPRSLDLCSQRLQLGLKPVLQGPGGDWRKMQSDQLSAVPLIKITTTPAPAWISAFYLHSLACPRAQAHLGRWGPLPPSPGTPAEEGLRGAPAPWPGVPPKGGRGVVGKQEEGEGQAGQVVKYRWGTLPGSSPYQIFLHRPASPQTESLSKQQ